MSSNEPTPHAALVKAVARALCCGDAACHNEDSGVDCCALAAEGREELARAAIAAVREALREPDARMVDAGEAEDAPAATYSGYSTEYADCQRHWVAMLAASPLAEDGDA